MKVGEIVKGSLDQGAIIRTARGVSSEDIRVGQMVIVEGVRHKFLALVNDIGHPEEIEGLPSAKEDIIRAFKGGLLRSNISASIIAQKEGNSKAEKAVTFPELLQTVRTVKAHDVKDFWGEEDLKEGIVNVGYLAGYPAREDYLVPIRLKILASRSFGIFGMTGTGKTFLGNILSGYLVGLEIANILAFDMHSEYGAYVRDDENKPLEKGCGCGLYWALRGWSIQLYYLEDELFDWVKQKVREEFGQELTQGSLLKISVFKINPEDVIACSEELGLGGEQVHGLRAFKRMIDRAVDNLRKGMRKPPDNKEIRELMEKILKIDKELRARNVRWYSFWLWLIFKVKGAEDVRKLCEACRIEKGEIESYVADKTLSAIVRKVKRLKRLGFLSEDPEDARDDVVERIANSLSKDSSVVISFGRYEDDPLAYVFVANVVCRRVAERFKSLREPPKRNLVIVVEEGHKFLSKEQIEKTPFGVIARELRKRGIVLCIIDQRPSQIDEDVLSQLWSKFVLCLDEEDDLKAALRGAPRSSQLRTTVPNLRIGEVLVHGKTISFPTVLKVRDYQEILQEWDRISLQSIPQEPLEQIGA